MLQWAFYALVVAALISLSGWLIEQALRRRQLPTRWAWVAAMSLTVLLAYLSLPVSIAPRAPQPRLLRESWTAIQRVAPLGLPPLPFASVAAARHTGTARGNALRFDTLLIDSWFGLSGLLALSLALCGARVSWSRRRWPLRLVESHCVGVARNVGPAVVGLRYPTIVIPRWVLDRPAAEQQLILAHEASHLTARDP
ncbi:MAG TPA: hypothetical protein VNZ06_12335, partial [Steroidobacteraceae bacterium]|nr:hypothetical protein [Steroidobacteraceae bacterium]